jgi:hypothetical protein
MKYANLYFLAVLFVCSVVMANLAFGSRVGIFPIGDDAVYIEDSACTVNMTPERSEEDILSDMLECIELHRQ